MAHLRACISGDSNAHSGVFWSDVVVVAMRSAPAHTSYGRARRCAAISTVGWVKPNTEGRQFAEDARHVSWEAN